MFIQKIILAYIAKPIFRGLEIWQCFIKKSVGGKYLIFKKSGKHYDPDNIVIMVVFIVGRLYWCAASLVCFLNIFRFPAVFATVLRHCYSEVLISCRKNIYA